MKDILYSNNIFFVINFNKNISMVEVSQNVREDINGKKTFSFGHCPNDGGGGGSTHAGIFWPSF